MTKNLLILDLETAGAATAVYTQPQPVEITYTDLAALAEGKPLQACEHTETHPTLRKALASAKRLIRAGKAWRDFVELTVPKGFVIADNGTTLRTEQVFDIHLNHSVEWGETYQSKVKKPKKHFQMIRMEPIA